MVGMGMGMQLLENVGPTLRNLTDADLLTDSS